MWVFGPDLHFDSNGKLLKPEERTHFWYFTYMNNQHLKLTVRYPTLSNKLGEDVRDKFKAVNFKPDPTHDLTVLLESARVPQTWESLLTNAIYLSGSCSFFVRTVTKQYPVVT